MSQPTEKETDDSDPTIGTSLLSSPINLKSEGQHERKGKDFNDKVVFQKDRKESAKNAVCAKSSDTEFRKPRSKHLRKLNKKPVRLISREKTDAKKCRNNSLAFRVDLSEYAAKKGEQEKRQIVSRRKLKTRKLMD